MNTTPPDLRTRRGRPHRIHGHRDGHAIPRRLDERRSRIVERAGRGRGDVRKGRNRARTRHDLARRLTDNESAALLDRGRLPFRRLDWCADATVRPRRDRGACRTRDGRRCHAGVGSRLERGWGWDSAAVVDISGRKRLGHGGNTYA